MKFPEMRKELIDYLAGLSDLQYQKDCWVSANCPEGIEYDELNFAIHFLFDDTELSTNPESLVGYILKNNSEAVVIQQLCKKIDQIFEKYGTGLSDAEYIEYDEWKDVISIANKAYTTIASEEEQ